MTEPNPLPPADLGMLLEKTYLYLKARPSVRLKVTTIKRSEILRHVGTTRLHLSETDWEVIWEKLASKPGIVVLSGCAGKALLYYDPTKERTHKPVTPVAPPREHPMQRLEKISPPQFELLVKAFIELLSQFDTVDTCGITKKLANKIGFEDLVDKAAFARVVRSANTILRAQKKVAVKLTEGKGEHRKEFYVLLSLEEAAKLKETAKAKAALQTKNKPVAPRSQRAQEQEVATGKGATISGVIVTLPTGQRIEVKGDIHVECEGANGFMMVGGVMTLEGVKKLTFTIGTVLAIIALLVIIV